MSHTFSWADAKKGWANASMFLPFRPEGTVPKAQPEGLGTPKPKTFGPERAVHQQASIMNGPSRAEITACSVSQPFELG
jgi:hypothetical protein